MGETLPLARIPVTIITGFLGSGKTTLLNQLINQNREKKIAIIENEFGEISIDSELVIKENEGIFELSNGCICCSLSGELKETLQKITEGNSIAHLIIETTGIADPGPIAISFLSDFEIQTKFQLDSIVCLVDSRFIETQLGYQAEASKQIALADVILLNKVDLVEAYQIETLKSIIGKINNQASIYESKFGFVDNLNILDIKGFGIDSVLKTKFENSSTTPDRKKLKVNKSSLETSENLLVSGLTTPHNFEVTSESFVFDQPLDVLKFDAWLNVMLNWGSGLFYRGKGILYIEDIDKKVVFQSVLNQFVTESGGEWGEEKKCNRIVFIGRYLDRKIILQGLLSCIVNDIDAHSEDFFNSLMDTQNELYSQMKSNIL